MCVLRGEPQAVRCRVSDPFSPPRAVAVGTGLGGASAGDAPQSAQDWGAGSLRGAGGVAPTLPCDGGAGSLGGLSAAITWLCAAVARLESSSLPPGTECHGPGDGKEPREGPQPGPLTRRSEVAESGQACPAPGPTTSLPPVLLRACGTGRASQLLQVALLGRGLPSGAPMNRASLWDTTYSHTRDQEPRWHSW